MRNIFNSKKIKAHSYISVNKWWNLLCFFTLFVIEIYDIPSIIHSTIVFIIFETFWWLSKFSFHHKWNEVWLLVIHWHIQVASRVVEQLKSNYITCKQEFVSNALQIIVSGNNLLPRTHLRPSQTWFLLKIMVTSRS